MTSFNLNQLQGKEAQQRMQLSTGKQFIYNSEDPNKANQSMVIKSSINQVDQYQKNISDTQESLKTVESILSSATDILQKAKEEGLKASNGTYNERDRNTFASVIEESIKQMVTLSNSQHLGKYLFSGEKTQTEPYTYNGTTVTYNGDADLLKTKVSPYLDVQTSVDGEQTFRQVFNSLISLRDTVKTNDTSQIATALKDVDTALNNTVDTRASIGVNLESLKMLDENYNAEKLSLDTRLSSIEDVDFTKVIMEYTQTQQIHQGMLAATKKMFDVSLINYL